MLCLTMHATLTQKSTGNLKEEIFYTNSKLSNFQYEVLEFMLKNPGVHSNSVDLSNKEKQR